METDFNKQLAIKDKNFIRNVLVFAVCLVISFLVWLSIKQSDSFTKGVSYPVKLINMPEGKLLVSSPEPLLFLSVESKGFSLFSSSSFRQDTIVFDLSRLKLEKTTGGYQGVLELYKRKNAIAKQLRMVSIIHSISPDKLTFKFVDLHRKKVPVVLDIRYTLDKQCYLFDELECFPDSVVVMGKKSVIDSITRVKTKHLDYLNINQPISETVELESPKISSDFRLEEDKVEIKIPVEKYTENTITIPITILNQDKKKKVKIFPDKIKVTYLVSLNKYNEIENDHFVAAVNAEKQAVGEKLAVKLVSKPHAVKVTRMKPERVEYIIIK